jgi:glycosyltransferase involved in cell wall biosynthesis
VVLNGVDSEAFHPGAEHPVADEPVDVLFVGNMLPHKGPQRLLAAARALVRAGVSNFRVVIVGSAGLIEKRALTRFEIELREEAARGDGDHVVFRPFVDRTHLPEVYRSASIFVMPVIWDEPAGQVVLEALASGLPVVAAPRGGIPEYLGDAGIYCDPEDDRALADALASLISSPALRHELGVRARQQALRYLWEEQFELFLRAVRK